MTRKLLVVLALLLLPVFSAADSSAPSDATIKRWLKTNEPMRISNVTPIQLQGGEKAFLAYLQFFDRGRCCNAEMCLVRPALKQAKELKIVSGVPKVLDLDDDAVSEIVLTGEFMGGGGQVAGRKIMVYFDGWKVVMLREAAYGHDLYMGCEQREPPSCSSSEVEWTFVDLDGDGSKDLVETYVSGEGDHPDRLKWTTHVDLFLFKNKRFIPVRIVRKKTRGSDQESP